MCIFTILNKYETTCEKDYWKVFIKDKNTNKLESIYTFKTHPLLLNEFFKFKINNINIAWRIWIENKSGVPEYETGFSCFDRKTDALLYKKSLIKRSGFYIPSGHGKLEIHKITIPFGIEITNAMEEVYTYTIENEDQHTYIPCIITPILIVQERVY